MTNNRYKTLYKTLNVIFWLIFALTMLFLTFAIISFSTVDRQDRNFFGFHFYCVESGSMRKSEKSKDESVFFNEGDLIFVKEIKDASTLKEGDVITFISLNADSYGEIITHKIRSCEYSTGGEFVGFITYGIYTGENDQTVVKPENVIGLYVGKLPFAGNVITFLRSGGGLVLTILLPCIMVLVFLSTKLGRNYATKEYENQIETLQNQVAKLKRINKKLKEIKTPKKDEK